MELNPRWQYKVNGIPANLTRGNFHKVGTGRWLGYSHSIPDDKIEIRLETCDCDVRPVYVTVAEFEAAEGMIECEYCGQPLTLNVYP